MRGFFKPTHLDLARLTHKHQIKILNKKRKVKYTNTQFKYLKKRKQHIIFK